MDFEEYWQAITPLEAQYSLWMIKLFSYPHLKKHDQEKVHREFYGSAQIQKRYSSLEDASRLING